MRFISIAVALLVVLGAGAASARSSQAPKGDLYVCPMHPDVHGAPGEKCKKCGMALVATGRDRFEPSVLDVEVVPRALKAGQSGTVRLTVRDPVTRAIVQDFENVHERPFHLFIVSHDLSYFSHVHPELGRDGSLRVPFTPPRPGAYQLFADFMPRGGTPQLVQRSFVTAGHDGLVEPVHLTLDLAAKVERGVRVELQLPADGLVAGRRQMFRVHLTGAATGEPVTDLQLYLGSWGHVLIVSEDLGEAVHSHPMDDFSDKGGPRIVFDALFPRAGVYRLWAQFQRAGQVFVAPFTVSVKPE
jgi:Heavy metal binding domain